MPDKELAKRIVDFLNSLLEVDREGVSRLVAARVRCNKAMGEHPTVQVAYDTQKQSRDFGIIGILNGLCGSFPNGWGCIGYQVPGKGEQAMSDLVAGITQVEYFFVMSDPKNEEPE